MKTKQYHSLIVLVGLLIGWLSPALGSAATKIYGIYYNVNATEATAEVTSGPYDNDYNPEDPYIGSISIPSSFDFMNKTYTVTSIGDQAFCNCTSLTSVTIPNSVTFIGDFAFYGCTSLTSVNIPNSVTEIGLDVFNGCSGLTSVEIPNSVTSIGQYAFRDCTSLTSVEIPNSVTSIGDYAFEGCTGLTSVTIPNSVTSIDDGAFYGCTGLTSLTLPGSVTSISYGSFYGCTGLISVTIPNSVTSIGNCAFTGCTSLTSVTIPNSVTYIGSSAFEGCNGLTSIDIPNSVTSIGDQAFFDCTSLTSIDIPNSVTSIGVQAFGRCTGLTSVTIPNSVTSIDEYVFDGCTSLTSVEIPNSVTSIGKLAFRDCTSLTSVTIPSRVTSIGYMAFSGCTGLTSITCENETPVTITNSVFSGVNKSTCTLYVPVGSEAAYRSAAVWGEFTNIVEQDASVLATGSCGDNLTYTIYEDMSMVITGTGPMWDYSEEAMMNSDYMSDINSVTIEEGCTAIGDDAFYGCTALTSVDIPNSVTSIGGYAFRGCIGLTSVYIPSSMTSIGDFAFYDCTGLTTISVDAANSIYDSRNDCNAIIETSTNTLIVGCNNTVIPNGVTKIGWYAFNSCTGLTSVDIPNSVKSIDWRAFIGCTGLTTLTIPNSVSKIDVTAFSYCSGLNSIYVDANNATYDSRENCHAIINTSTNTLIAGCKNTVIPNSVTSIGGYAFTGCTELTSIEIPNSVTSIDVHAFESCTGLTSIDIPNSVTRIGSYAFFGCTELTSVDIPGSVTSIDDLAFAECTSLSSISVGMTTPITITDLVFHGVNKSACTLYVPAGCMSAYQNAEVWRDFERIEERASSVLATGPCGDNLTYTIYDDMSMVISGTGPMWDYSRESPLNSEYMGAINSVTIEEGCTAIGTFAFSGCTGLTSVAIPNSVTSIGEYAFWGSTALTSVDIPNSVTSIGWNAFSNTGLTTVTIPNSVSYISLAAFSYCSGLNSIYIDANNTTYDSRENCHAIIETSTNTLIAGCNNTVIPNSVTSIDTYAFAGCTGLTSIDIPNSVTSIGNSAFLVCTGLTSVDIPSSVTSIDDLAFADCTSLSSISVGMTTPIAIPDLVFYGVNKSTCTLYVPAGCKTAYQNAEVWRDFEHIEERVSSVLATGPCGDNLTYAIYDDMSMVITGTGPMWDYSEEAMMNSDYMGSITSVTIEEGCTAIGTYAFFECSGLTSVDIPNSVTCIGEFAFWGCTGMTSVDIPNSVTSIDWCAFSHCTGLASLTIPSSVTSIGSYAFNSCSGLTSIYVDANNAIYDSRENCNAIIETSTNTLIAGCNNTVIPNSVTGIGVYAFSGCIGLTSIDIPSGVTSIGHSAFESCTGLTTVTISNSVASIDLCVFRNCSSLTSIYVDESNATYDSRENCNAIIETSTNKLIAGCKNTVIPNSVTSIGGNAFDQCTGLTSIDIPSSVTYIGGCAFQGCTGLTSIDIPSSVTSIISLAFYRCTSLTSISVGMTTPLVINENVFEGVNKSSCILYVPTGSKTAYQEAEVWGEFENIVEIGEEPDTDISALDNAIYVERTRGMIGETMDLSVKIKNDFSLRGFKFKLELPTGATINSWKVSTQRLPTGASLSDVIKTQNIDGNKITVAATLQGFESGFTGNDGEVATINVTFANDMEAGTYPIFVTDCDLSDPEGSDMFPSDVKSTLVLTDFLAGDANGDGQVRIGDAIAVLNYIVGNTSDNFSVKAADVNGDGRVLIGDVIFVLNIIVNQ